MSTVLLNSWIFFINLNCQITQVIPHDAAEDVRFYFYYFNKFLSGIIFVDTGLLMVSLNTWLFMLTSYSILIEVLTFTWLGQSTRLMNTENVMSCQLRVTATSCFVYKVFRDLESIDHVCINPIRRIGLIYK